LKKFHSLLHFIEASQIEHLSQEDIDIYLRSWLESRHHPIRDIYGSEEEIIAAAQSLKDHLSGNKLLFNHPDLLLLMETGKVKSGLKEDIINISPHMVDEWLKSTIEHSLEDSLVTNTLTQGFPAVQSLKKLEEPFHHLPLNIQDLIESRVRRRLKDYFIDYERAIDSGDLSSTKGFVSGHFLQSIKALPFESGDLLENYGKKCEFLVRKYMNDYKEGKLNENEEASFAKASEIAANILKYDDISGISKEIKKQKESKEKDPVKSIIKILTIAISVVIIGWGGMKIYRIIEDETSTYDERYAEYVKKNNEFLKNRQISKEIIEQRKVTDIVDSYQYGERENVPLFYTFIKTNKYLDINDIDAQLFKLKSAINTEGIDTDKIFALVHFFTTDMDNAYRKVLAEYSSFKSTVKYKQIVKPRGSKSFKVNDWSEKPHKMTVEVEESYPSGVMELVIYDLVIDPDENKVEIYNYTPMPELSSSLDLSAFRQMQLHGGEIDDTEVGGMVQLMEDLISGHQYKYRIPYYPGDVSYDVERAAITPMYNWELTTSDDLAFIRVRSDDAKGYYLVDTESGRISQAKISFKKKDQVRRSFLVQWTPQ